MFPKIRPHYPAVTSSVRRIVSILLLLALLYLLFGSAQPAYAQTGSFIVSNTNDSGVGSLRQAISDANNSGFPMRTIIFNIPIGDSGFDGSVFTIRPLTALPAIRNGIEIDGATQSAFTGDTNGSGPEIMLDGGLTTSGSGIYISGDNNRIANLAIGNFTNGSGINADYVLDATPSNNRIENNFIGIDAIGLQARPNNSGISLHGFGSPSLPAADNVIDNNLISGNLYTGIGLCDTRGTIIRGNRIGPSATGGAGQGNGSTGIHMVCAGATSSLIEQNVIAYNTGDGIVIEPDYRFGNSGMNSNRIHANAIYSNTGLGINLYPPPYGFVDGVTANDAGDADTGANALQNFPVMQWAESNGTSTTVSGTLTSIASQPFAIEFFANSAGDASGHGEGERYLGVITVTTDATGNTAFLTVLPTGVAGAGRLTATATDSDGNTSEFSAHVDVASISNNRTLAVAPTATALSSTWLTVYSPFGGDANRNNYTVCEYATAASGPWSPAPDGDQAGDEGWRYCTPSGLTPNTDYYVRITFQDADGVDGINPQVLGPLRTAAAATDGVSIGQTTVIVQDTHLLVTTPISADANRNSALVSVETATAPSGPWTLRCSPPATFSPVLCRIHSLIPSTEYWVQVTVGDPEIGVQTQMVGPVRYTGLSNLAFQKTVTADPGWGCCSNPAQLVDGGIQDPSWGYGFAWTGGLANWAGGAPGWKQATIDLGISQAVARVDWWPHQSTVVPMVWRIEVSSDGVTYAEVYSSIVAVCRAVATPLSVSWGAPRCAHRAFFAPVNARYVRYSFDDRTLLDNMHGWGQEIEVFGPVTTAAPLVIVPAVTGMTQSQAASKLASASLTMGTVTAQPSPTVPAGVVISQTPAASNLVASGSVVAFVVSSGPLTVSAPNVVGKVLQQARADLAAAGLTVSEPVATQPSPTAPEGTVVSQNPPAGSMVASGSPVALVVSSGPPTWPVPDVVGKTLEQARADLASAGLSVGQITTQSNPTVPAGSVISQAPSAGSQVESGSPVVLVVSSGPDGANQCGSATPLAAGVTVSATTDSPGDIDLYQIEVTQPNTTVNVLLYHPDQDYDLYLYDGCATTMPPARVIGQGRHVGGEYAAFNITNHPGTYYVAVIGYNGASSPTPYTLRVDLNADSDEPNDHCYEAIEMAPAASRTSYLSHAADLDFYKVRIDAAYSMLTVRLNHATQDYNLALFSGCVGSGGQGRHVGESPGPGEELLTYPVGSITGWYYIAVRGANYAYSTEPYTVEVQVTPPPPVGTLILTNRQRIGNLYGASAEQELYAKLIQFATHPSVKGLVVDLNDDPNVRAAYISWDGHPDSPDAANIAATSIHSLIATHLRQFPGIRFVVIAGSDWVIPFNRIPVKRYTTDLDLEWQSENAYLAEIGWPLSASVNPTQAALSMDYTLSDDIYGSDDGIPFQKHMLYIPRRAVGRLVETPTEMIKVMDAFLRADGVSTIDQALGVGSDFLVDGAQSICNRFESDGLPSQCRADNSWDAAWLRGQFMQGAWDMISISAHARHNAFLSPQSGTLQSSELAGATNPPATLLYSLGCQAGLNVPPGAPAEVDWPQAAARRGTNFVGNTGWGYGVEEGIGLSETLLDLYTVYLVQGQTTTLGEALVFAKNAYYLGEPASRFDHYDEKILVELTLYGLPMWRVVTPDLSSAVAAANVTTEAVAPAVESTYVPSASAVAAGPMREDRHIYFDTNDMKETLTGTGIYYTYGQDGLRTDPGSPIQPAYIASTYANRGLIHGAALVGARYSTSLPGFDPVVATAQTSSAAMVAAEPEISTTGWTPTAFVDLKRLPGLYDDGSNQALVLTLGQYRAEGQVERLYSEIEVRLFRSDSDDWTPPNVDSLKLVGSQIEVVASDASGIYTVLVAYDTNSAEWNMVELAPTDGRWLGAMPVGATAHQVQVVDLAGNVAIVGGEKDLSVFNPPSIYLPTIMR